MKKSMAISIRVDGDDYEKLNTIANANGLLVTDLVKIAIKKFLNDFDEKTLKKKTDHKTETSEE